MMDSLRQSFRSRAVATRQGLRGMFSQWDFRHHWVFVGLFGTIGVIVGIVALCLFLLDDTKVVIVAALDEQQKATNKELRGIHEDIRGIKDDVRRFASVPDAPVHADSPHPNSDAGSNVKITDARNGGAFESADPATEETQTLPVRRANPPAAAPVVAPNGSLLGAAEQPNSEMPPAVPIVSNDPSRQIGTAAVHPPEHHARSTASGGPMGGDTPPLIAPAPQGPANPALRPRLAGRLLPKPDKPVRKVTAGANPRPYFVGGPEGGQGYFSV